MKSISLKGLAVGAVTAGMFWVNALPALAQTDPCTLPESTTNCIQMNGGGSSAATPFSTQVPLNVLDQAPNLPIHYVNGDIASPSITKGKLHTWVGTNAGVPTIIRYSATGSSDGIVRLQQVVANSLSNLNFLNRAGLTGCSAPVLQTRPSDSKQYYEYTGCTGNTPLPVHLGASDVAGSSFHQTGGGVTVKPLDQSQLTSTQVAIVPWKFVLGNSVKRVNPSNPATLTTVHTLSRTEIEAVLSRNVTDWRLLGLVTDVTTPGTPDATSPISLCIRIAGSGSKAALDETVMKDATETPFGSTVLTNAAPGVYFGGSTQDVIDCLGGNTGNGRPAHPTAIGYVDADVATPGAYAVALNGLYANDTTLTDAKENVKCGKYLYWAGERFNVRNYADPDISSDQTALINEFIGDASSAATISLMPAGAFWVAVSDMYVTKNADAGPIAWKAGAHPCASN